MKKTLRPLVALVSISMAAMTMLAMPAQAATVTLTVWDAGLVGHIDNGVLNPKTSWIYQMAKGFEAANPGVKVKISELDGGVADTQFRAASIAGNGPDIKFGFAGGNTLSFSNFLLPLDKYFTAAELLKIKGLGTNRKGYKANGALVALPIGAGSYFYIFYNKKITKQYGFDMATAPSTWEGFLSLAKQMKAAGIQTPIWETNQEGYTGAWVIASLVGGELGPTAFADMYSGKTSINSPAVVKAYTGYKKLYTAGVTNPDATSRSQGDRLSGFLAGNGAMMIDGAWDNQPLYAGLGGNVGQFPIPTLKGAKYPGILAGGPNVAAAITKYSKNKAVAVKFLKYITGAKQLDKYVAISQTEASNHVNANPKLITNPLLRGQARDVAKRLQVYPFDNIMPGPICDLFYRLNASVALGQTSPADAAKQLADTFATTTK